MSELQYQQQLLEEFQKSFLWNGTKYKPRSVVLSQTQALLKTEFTNAIRQLNRETLTNILTDIGRFTSIDELLEYIYQYWHHNILSDTITFKPIKTIQNGFFNLIIEDRNNLQRSYIIYIFDKHHVDNNKFTVIREVGGKAKSDTDKVDFWFEFIFFINGIPIGQLEVKDFHKSLKTWEDAMIQILHYKQALPWLYNTVLIAAVADNRSYDEEMYNMAPMYFAPFNIPVEKVETIEHMTTEEKRTLGYIWEKHLILPSIYPAKDIYYSKQLHYPLHYLGFLHKETFADIVFWFLRLVEKNDDKTVVVLPRAIQYRAVNKIVNHYKLSKQNNNKLDNDVPNKNISVNNSNGGIIWHWQGTGKTYTMLWAASKLMQIENTHVLFVVDRIYLDEQLTREASQMFPYMFKRIKISSDIKKVLDTFNRSQGARAFITTIDKIYIGLSQDKEQPNFTNNNNGQIKDVALQADNVVIFVDEGHRSQGGKKGYRMRSELAPAKRYAFTGTPILTEEKKNTELLFGPIIDKFFLDDAVRYNIVLPIKYMLGPVELQTDTSKIKNSIRKIETEYDDETLTQLSMELKYSVAKNIDNRIQSVTKDIIEQYFQLFYSKGLKALLSVESREMAVKYRNYLIKALGNYINTHFQDLMTLSFDEKNTDKFAEVVISYNNANDSSTIINYFNEATQRWGFTDSNADAMITHIIDKFKYTSGPPYILVVVNKLTTGFDMPRLGVVFLDRVIKGRHLLQLAARTNRKYPGKKYGYLIDYMGVTEYLKEALQEYAFTKEEIKVINEQVLSLLDIKQLEDMVRDMEKQILQTWKQVDKTLVINTVTFNELGKFLDSKQGYNLLKNIGLVKKTMLDNNIFVHYTTLYNQINEYLYYTKMLNKAYALKHKPIKYNPPTTISNIYKFLKKVIPIYTNNQTHNIITHISKIIEKASDVIHDKSEHLQNENILIIDENLMTTIRSTEAPIQQYRKSDDLSLTNPIKAKIKNLLETARKQPTSITVEKKIEHILQMLSHEPAEQIIQELQELQMQMRKDEEERTNMHMTPEMFYQLTAVEHSIQKKLLSLSDNKDANYDIQQIQTLIEEVVQAFWQSWANGIPIGPKQFRMKMVQILIKKGEQQFPHAKEKLRDIYHYITKQYQELYNSVEQ